MKNILSIFLFIWGNDVFAQNSIKGKIVDETGPLPGANIIIQGTSTGATTDMEGRFTINNSPKGSQTLLVSFIGYEKFEKKIEVTEGENNVGELKLSQGKQLGEVVIEGDFRGTEAKAFNMTKTSPRIVNVIASDGVGKLPDRNVAEAIQRVPAVAIERDQGEGRYVSIRGTPTDWSASLINGNRLPVADENANSRTLSFDVIPTDLIEYIILSKALTPDQEGDAIGGSLNFISRTAPRQRTLTASLSGGMNFQSMGPAVNASVLWGDRSKNKRFGYIINGMYYNRSYGTDNYEVVYGSNYNHGVNRLELRDYIGTRQTIGANASAEYNLNDQSKIFVKGVFGRMTDNEHHRKTRYNWAEGAGQTISFQNIHDIMESTLFGGEVGGNYKLHPKWNLEYKVSSYHNRFGYGPVPFERGDSRNGYNVVEFKRFQVNFTDQIFIDPETGEQVSPNTPGAWRIKLIGDDYPGGGGDDPNNIQPQYTDSITADQFIFNDAYSELNTTWERDPIVGQLDLTWNVRGNLTLKAGGKYRWKQGFRELSLYEWDQNFLVTTNAIRLTQFDNEALNTNGGFLQELGSNYEDNFFPFLTNGQLADFYSVMDDSIRGIEMNSNHPQYEEWIGSKYRYDEQVVAGYAMADWNVFKNKLQITGGLRLEQTYLSMTADTAYMGFVANRYIGIPGMENEVYISVYNDTLAANFLSYRDAIAVYHVPVIETTSTTKYLSVLPMLHFTYRLGDKANIRLAATRSLRRPNFNETKPGSPVKDYTNLEYNIGNRNLKPSYSWNFDLMGEYYFGNIGMISAGVFYKYVTDHIFATITADVDQRTGIIYKSFRNADNSYVVGVEASFNRRFDFLPGFLSGFGFNGNYTYIHSEMRVPGRTKAQPLPRQAEHLFNAALFYEKHGVNARLALNYKGAYLYEMNLAAVADAEGNPILLHDNTDFDVFMDDFLSMDFSLSYNFKKHWTVFGEANNLLNWPYRLYRGNRDRPVQVEYYDVRALVGVKFSL
ncbi:MAG: TonB-dependent receptor [Flavobacteriales bacterium]|nr:TonB-dependent receptor [Flavobacteriales bacterium]